MSVITPTMRLPMAWPVFTRLEGKSLGVRDGLHEGARAALDVEDQGFGAFGHLLGQDAGGYEGHRFDGGRHVAQRIEFLVGGNDGVGLAGHREAVALDVLAEALLV